MLRALELARKGKTAPNPMVGAVLVKKDKIIAEGFHPYAGGPHAEIAALKKAVVIVAASPAEMGAAMQQAFAMRKK